MPVEFPEPHFLTTNGLRMALHEAGEGYPVILCHGFPELAYSWRYQLPALADAGFRAIAPDQRGYGASDKPDGVAAYRIQELIADLTGLLDILGYERAVFVGHDWGAILLWQMALLAPERMAGLINLNIPFYPRTEEEPIARMREKLGDEFYIVHFQDSDEADRRFAAEPQKFFESMLRRRPISRKVFDTLPLRMRAFSMLKAMQRQELPGTPLLNPDELAVFVDAYTAGGFTAPINWYRNWTRNWESTAEVEQYVRVPTLFIGATDDVVVSPAQIEAMRPHVADLELHMIDKCGHWTQQEQPEQVNALILDWLSRRSLGQ